jgi:hypothetical protein
VPVTSWWKWGAFEDGLGGHALLRPADVDTRAAPEGLALRAGDDLPHVRIGVGPRDGIGELALVGVHVGPLLRAVEGGRVVMFSVSWSILLGEQERRGVSFAGVGIDHAVRDDPQLGFVGQQIGGQQAGAVLEGIGVGLAVFVAQCLAPIATGVALQVVDGRFAHLLQRSQRAGGGDDAP